MVTEQRQHFRIYYPTSYHPTLIFAGETYRVINLCEQGIKFDVTDYDNFHLGQSLKVTLRFTDGERLMMSGQIFRKDANGIVICMSERIPLNRIRAEELNLIRKFPGYRSHGSQPDWWKAKNPECC